MAFKRNPAWSGFFVEHDRVLSNTSGPSRTRQEFAAECDINTIMVKYEATGVISHYNTGVPQYLDLDGIPQTLEETLGMLEKAKESFMRLPARVRLEFSNDPVQFVDFAMDPKNLDQMILWGLAPPRELPDAPRENVSTGGSTSAT